jgi:hypothetical protein
MSVRLGAFVLTGGLSSRVDSGKVLMRWDIRRAMTP